MGETLAKYLKNPTLLNQKRVFIPFNSPSYPFPLYSLPMTSPHLITAERVAQVALSYYRLADSFSATIHEAFAWYQSLPPAAKQRIGVLSPHEWFHAPDFKRYLLEKNGLSFSEYMSTHLTPHELNYWLLHGDGVTSDGGML